MNNEIKTKNKKTYFFYEIESIGQYLNISVWLNAFSILSFVIFIGLYIDLSNKTLLSYPYQIYNNGLIKIQNIFSWVFFIIYISLNIVMFGYLILILSSILTIKGYEGSSKIPLINALFILNILLIFIFWVPIFSLIIYVASKNAIKTYLKRISIVPEMVPNEIYEIDEIEYYALKNKYKNKKSNNNIDLENNSKKEEKNANSVNDSQKNNEKNHLNDNNGDETNLDDFKIGDENY